MFIRAVSSGKKGLNDFSRQIQKEVKNENLYIQKKVNKKINVKKLKMYFFDSVFSVRLEGRKGLKNTCLLKIKKDKKDETTVMIGVIFTLNNQKTLNSFLFIITNILITSNLQF